MLLLLLGEHLYSYEITKFQVIQAQKDLEGSVPGVYRALDRSPSSDPGVPRTSLSLPAASGSDAGSTTATVYWLVGASRCQTRAVPRFRVLALVIRRPHRARAGRGPFPVVCPGRAPTGPPRTSRPGLDDGLARHVSLAGRLGHEAMLVII